MKCMPSPRLRNAVRPHVPEEEFHAFADGELSLAQRAEIAEHLLACLICRSVFGEVEEVRVRSSQLLAIASPRFTRRVAAPARTPKVPRAWAGLAAAGIAILGATTWIANQPGAPVTGNPRLATAFVAPTLFARVATDGGATVAAHDLRTLTLASRAVITPRVVAPTPSALVMRRFRPVEPLAEVDPSTGWETISWEGAVALSHGPIARLDGIPVNLVRLSRSSDGGRPTFMVRHLLPDGRSLWVVEGLIENVDPIHQLLEASGLSTSSPVRANPDYIGSERMIRVVTIAGVLPVDSLNEMRAKLILQ